MMKNVTMIPGFAISAVSDMHCHSSAAWEDQEAKIGFRY